MAIDPVRSAEILFTSPYLVIEGTYMVQRGSTFATVEDVDRETVRIAIGSGGAYDLFLSRTLKFAQLVRRPTGQAAFELFVNDGLEAAAGVRQALVQFAQAHPGLRVMDGRFMLAHRVLDCVDRAQYVGVRPRSWESCWRMLNLENRREGQWPRTLQ
jgi:polar amino acid transport system substrate-binding protein